MTLARVPPTHRNDEGECAKTNAGDLSDVAKQDSANIEPGIITAPMLEKVKTKLTAWSWQTDQLPTASTNPPRWLQLTPESSNGASSSNELATPEPFSAPPNTAPPSGQASTKPSGEQTPASPQSNGNSAKKPVVSSEEGDFMADVEEATSNRKSSLCRRRSLPTPVYFARQLSNLAFEDAHFKSHRDSVDLIKSRILRHTSNTNGTMQAPYPDETMDETASRLSTSITASQLAGSGTVTPITDASPPRGNDSLLI